MSRAILRALFGELAERGIELRLADRQIQSRPKGAMTTDLAQRVRAMHAEVIAQLEARSDPFTAEVLELFQGTIVGEDAWSETAPFHGPLTEPGCCYVCGSSWWWRLKRGGPAVCQRCRPCPHGEERVDWWEGAA